MKRFLIVSCIAGLLGGLPLSHEALAGGKKDNDKDKKKKVDICHIPNGNPGHVITVSKNAVPAHLRHGDCLAKYAKFDKHGNCFCKKKR